MDWTDSGIVLGTAKHGEAGAIIETMTQSHGRHRGYVRGGAGRRLKGVLQPGNAVRLAWRARLEDSLGTFTVELEAAHAAAALSRPDRLDALNAACALLVAALPEREPHPSVHAGLTAFLELLAEPSADAVHWAAGLVQLEAGLLTELGYGLDLTRCAATGQAEELVYVSPKSGRAVSRAAGQPYRDRLFTLPAFLLGAQAGPPTIADVLDGLTLTGFFLDRQIMTVLGKPLPAARERLIDRLSR